MEESALSSPEKKSACNQPWNTIYVRWNGVETLPCCFGPNDFGDLNTSSLADVWNGPAFQACRRQLLAGQPVGTCIPCVRGHRMFVDHLANFGEGIRTGYYKINATKRANYERARQNFLDGKVELDNWPFMLFLDVSSKCAIRCRKCYVYNQVQLPPLGHMSMELFEKITPILPYVIQVSCTGIGEAVLNPHFMDFVQILCQHECFVSFNTNGNTLTTEMCETLVKGGVREIVWSIDSLDEERYAYHHRGGNLGTVMANLDAIVRTKQQLNTTVPVLCWVVVGMKSNVGELPQIVQKAADLGFQSLHVASLIPAAGGGMKRCYDDFYAQENVVSSQDDRQRLLESLQAAKEVAARGKVGFSSGYFAALNAEAEAEAETAAA